ncbi:MAG: glycosyltransferase family 2 protein [Pelagimonas sp.]|jgi:hypothetical protein|nr:glycosyltransferase family 2 protein [Pelagimonas sp.]
MRILCVTSVKNEAPYLLDWLAHIRGVGVTDVLIYSNDCSDGTHEMLQALKTAGIVTHMPQTLAAEESPQWQALRAAWKHPLRKTCDWALVCDTDEYLNIHVGQGRIPDLIKAVPTDTDAITLPWRLFGSSGQIWAQDRPTPQVFTRAATPECQYPIAASFFKSLFRLNGPFNQFGVHRPRQKSPDKAGLPRWVDGSGQRLPRVFCETQNRLSLLGYGAARDLVEMNHYSLRSVESFVVKQDRGLPNRSDKKLDLSYWAERNFNTVEDLSIQRMAPACDREYAQLMALPGIRDLHDRGVAWHRARFAQLSAQAHVYKLFTRLALCGDSRELPQDVAQRLLAGFAKAEGAGG